MRQYCAEQKYDFVWFCKDIERVYTGKKVNAVDKKKKSEEFKKKKQISGVKVDKLSAAEYQENTSNILRILEQYLDMKYLIISLDKIENISYLRFQFQKYGLYVYEMGAVNKKEELKESLKENEILFYLDYFVIILPKEYSRQSFLWTRFYKIFGELYENMIDKSINLECIGEMLSYICKKIEINSSSTILDYGCGSGLSTLVPFEGKIIGYEPIYEMRRQARYRGMLAVSSSGIQKIPENYFDAVFSSYVFHMAVSEENIKYIINKMKPDAFWIANFYKGMNEEVINTIFQKNNFIIEQVYDMQEKFGNVYEYRRNGTTGNKK